MTVNMKNNNYLLYPSVGKMLVFFLFSVVFTVVFGSSVKKGEASKFNDWPPTPCDSLVPQYCMFPFPNNYYLQMDDNYNPMHLVLSEEGLPIDHNGRKINPQAWNVLDGFTALPPILTYFEDLSIENCAPLWNIAASMEDNSPVILLEAETGNIIPHWVELDHISDNPVNGQEPNRTMMIWPSHRLTDGERYIVALRNLFTNGGNPVTLSEGWVALRDNTSSNDISINSRRDYFQTQIFDVLTSYGIDYKTLDLAWDFTVMSTEQQTNRFITMRDDAFSRIDPTNGVKYRITEIDNNFDNDTIARKINGFMTVPLYLNTPLPGMHVRIVTEWDNPLMPVYVGDWEWEFEILVPNSVANHSLMGRYIQYGHGLFGSFHEIESGYLREEANEYGYILSAVNWIGMCWEDVAFITEMITFNLTNMAMVPDRLSQGMLNALFLMKLLTSDGFLNDPSLLYFDNKLVVNPENRNYYGNSQGGIMGGVYMSVTTDVINGVLGVPGAPYAILLPRSCDFNAFMLILKERYHFDFDRVILFNIIQLLWDRMEPIGYINHLNKNSLIGTPIHNVLIHYGLGDAQVTWLGAELMGRSMNSYMFSSNVEEYNETLFGFNFISDETTIDINSQNGTVLTQGWNYNLPQVPFVNKPPDCSYDSHGYTRKQATAQAANNRFFTQGIIYNPCGGPCNGQSD